MGKIFQIIRFFFLHLRKEFLVLVPIDTAVNFKFSDIFRTAFLWFLANMAGCDLLFALLTFKQ